MNQITQKIFTFLGEIAETVLIALAIFLAVYIFLAQPHRVKGDSMEPNFLNGELILTDKISYRFRQPDRGEVIVFKAAPTNGKLDFIKRIVGLPSEKILVKNGSVFINGKLLKENYLGREIRANLKDGGFLKNGQEYLIPENSFFVMGDNRGASFDSRDWGPVQKDEIIGKAFLVYWPVFPSKQSKGLRLVPKAQFEISDNTSFGNLQELTIAL